MSRSAQLGYDAAMRELTPDSAKSLRTQQLALFGVAALAFIIGGLDGINGFIHFFQAAQAKQEVLMARSRWYFTFSLPVVSLIALGLAYVAHRRQQLFEVKTMVLSGVAVVCIIFTLSITALIFFDAAIESRGYARCSALDTFQGVSRHGVPNTISTAWALQGACIAP